MKEQQGFHTSLQGTTSLSMCKSRKNKYKALPQPEVYYIKFWKVCWFEIKWSYKIYLLGDTLLVTELITGKNLLTFLKSKTHQKGQYENEHFGLNDCLLLNIALQIALGMQHLHERKVCRLALNNSNSKNSSDNYLAKPTNLRVANFLMQWKNSKNFCCFAFCYLFVLLSF